MQMIKLCQPRIRPGLVLLLSVLVSVAPLGGCRGMQEGSPNRSIGELVDDTYITSAINRALLADPELSFLEIDIDVHRGAVVLNGRVPSFDAERKLVELARGVRGVTGVQSRLVMLPGTPRM